MLEDIGSGFTKGTYFFFQDRGPVSPGKVTHVFDVCRKDTSILIGHIRWTSQWKKYCFVPLVTCGAIDSISIREIADFCDQETDKRKVYWKPKMPKGKHSEAYRKKLLARSSTVERLPVKELVVGSIPTGSAILEE